MKKILSLLAVTLLAGAMSTPVFAMNETDIQGTWYLGSVVESGEEINAAEMGMEMVLEISADGSFSLGMAGDYSEEGTWKIDGEALILTVDDEPVSVNLVDEQLVLEDHGTMMNFSREKVEIEKIVLGSIVENPELSDFDGTWTATAVEAFGMYMGAVGAEIEMTVTVADGKASIHFNGGDEPIDVEDIPVEVKDGRLVISDVAKVENMTSFLVGYNDFKFGLDENGIMFIGDPEKMSVEVTEGEDSEETEIPDITVMVYFVKEEA